MSAYEILSLAMSALTALIALGGLAYAGFQLKQAREYGELSYKVHQAEHDWNRRLAAQNALKDYAASVALGGLQKAFDYLNKKEAIPLDEVMEKFRADSGLQSELHNMLNAYEGLARGVQHGIYDEEVIKAGRRKAMTKTFRMFHAYIEDRRSKVSSPSAWSELERIVNQWMHEATRQEPRPPTDVRH
ncbi:hypothetical protein MASR1M60_25610 [Rhodocyclaceae bacterium]